ncbi:DUF4129 domain-containing protein [Deinococcus murrayi]|uniref:DUF4129 domain-containing protein n=1 Tax=Deinococcus murrayi TaxID=68910 RepID=UPI00047FFC0C|nr:DUF4129 domain-containing protein [Deinococcus murrayi]
MTTLPAPPERRPLRADRSWLLLAAPFVAASWLPWWGVLAFFGVLLLIRRDQAAEVVRVPLLLAAAGVTVLPLLAEVQLGGENALAAILSFAALFLPVVGAAAVIHIGLNLLEVGRPAGVAWLALLLLPGVLGLAPSPVFGLPAGLGLGLLALLLCALGSTGREERPARRLTGSGRAVWNAALVGGVLAGALALGTLALGPARQTETVRAAPGAAASQPDAAPQRQSEFPSGEGEGATGRAPAPLSPEATAAGVQLPGADLVLLGGMLLLMSVVFLLWRLPKRVVDGPRRFHWWEVAAVAGMLLLGALLLFYGLSAGGSGGPSTAPAPAGEGGVGGAEGGTLEEASPWWALAFASWFNRLAFLASLLLTAVILIFAWRLRRPVGDDLPVALPTAEAVSAPHAEALHRVRLAYRSAQAALERCGLGRGPAETPAEHAARASLNLPDLAAPLGTLVAAYAPVRYGGRVTDEDADRAEEAARDIAALSAEYRPPTLPDTPDSSPQETP